MTHVARGDSSSYGNVANQQQVIFYESNNQPVAVPAIALQAMSALPCCAIQ